MERAIYLQAIRIDHHVISRPERSRVFIPEIGTRFKGIGGIRVAIEEDGRMKGDAKLLVGVIVTGPDGKTHEVEKQSHVPFSHEPINLGPGESMSFERQRIIRGNTKVTIAHPVSL